jgi:hypothetical protein
VLTIGSKNASDQLIPIIYALLNSLQNLTLLESRTLSITLRQSLQPLSYIANIDLSTLEQLMTLNKVPRGARIKKPFAGNRAHRDTVLTLWSWARRTGSFGHQG